MKFSRLRIDPINFIFPGLILLGWYLVTKTDIVAAYLLPGPGRILKVLIDFIGGNWGITPYSGKFIENLIASFIRVIGGFSIAVLIGLPMGFLTGRIPIAKRILDPTVHAIRTVPGIGWLPLAMVWFGLGEKTTIFLIALAAFFPIYINTAHGASEVASLLIRAGRMLGANRIDLFQTVIFPSAFPSAVVGLRLGLGISWAYLVLGELTGVSSGLGAVMMDSRMMGQVEMIIVTMACIAIMGVVTDRLLFMICLRIHPFMERR